MSNLQQIEKLTRAYVDAHRNLADEVEIIQAEIAEVRRAHIRRLRQLAGKAKERRALVLEMVQAGPDLFTKPRSITIDGVKVGYRKQPSKIGWLSAAEVLARIRRRFGKDAEDYIRVSESPDKAALKELSAEQLKKLGVQVIPGVDVPFCQATDDVVDKLVQAMMEEEREPVEVVG